MERNVICLRLSNSLRHYVTCISSMTDMGEQESRVKNILNMHSPILAHFYTTNVQFPLRNVTPYSFQRQLSWFLSPGWRGKHCPLVFAARNYRTLVSRLCGVPRLLNDPAGLKDAILLGSPSPLNDKITHYSIFLFNNKQNNGHCLAVSRVIQHRKSIFLCHI